MSNVHVGVDGLARKVNALYVGCLLYTSTSISSSSGALSSEAARAARTAVTAASAALSSSAGSGIGSNFARGIAAGIRAGSSAISAAAQSAAQSALSAAKSKLGIKSPSKVAEKEVGWMWDAGLAQGISGKMALVERAASDVSLSLIHI